MQPPARFRRSLFGYSPRRVRAFIADRPTTPDTRVLEADRRVAGLEADLARTTQQLDARSEDLRATEQQAAVLSSKLDALRTALTGEIQKVWAAELRVHELGTELGTARERLREAEEEPADEPGLPGASRTDDEEVHPHEPWTTDELAPVLDLAERTVTNIMSEARRRGEVELQMVQEEVTRLREETRRLEAWRERVEPMVDPVQRSAEQARVEAERVGGLIRQALEPMTSAVTTLGERLVDLAEAASEPVEPASEGAQPASDAPTVAAETTSATGSTAIVDVTDEPADAPSR